MTTYTKGNKMNIEERKIYNNLRNMDERHLYLAPDNKTVYILGNPGEKEGLYDLTRSEPFDPESETIKEELNQFVKSFFK